MRNWGAAIGRALSCRPPGPHRRWGGAKSAVQGFAGRQSLGAGAIHSPRADQNGGPPGRGAAGGRPTPCCGRACATDQELGIRNEELGRGRLAAPFSVGHLGPIGDGAARKAPCKALPAGKALAQGRFIRPEQIRTGVPPAAERLGAGRRHAVAGHVLLIRS